MQIKVYKKAQKFIQKQEQKNAIRIISALEGLKEKPFQGDIKNLSKRDELRLRVGDFRIIFQERNGEIHILRIDNRGDVYKK